LYPVERKTLAREDVVAKMRKDISVNIVSDFGGNTQDLQAFRIAYSGRDPRLVAQVATELATQFIDENLKAREQEATGTTDFLQSQLQATRKALEGQEAKLRDFRMKHIGEMPEQENSDLQILGQLRSQLQLEGEGLARAEQQKSYLQSMMTQTAPVVDLDEAEPRPSSGAAVVGGKVGSVAGPANSKLSVLRVKLAVLQGRGYTDHHPEIRKVKQEISDEEAAEKASKPAAVSEVAQTAAHADEGHQAEKAAKPAPPSEVASAPSEPTPIQPTKRAPASPRQYVNPVLQAQLKTVEDEIAKHKEEQQRLNRLAAGYQGKLETIPVRQQEIADLVRDYEISKGHYQQLLDKQLSAETATQLEIRQKGEKFSILDPAQPAERPSSPNRPLINAGGAVGGLVLGLVLALITEFIGISITSPDQMVEVSGIPVLEIIPVIETHIDRRLRRKRLLWATVSGLTLAVTACCAFLVYHYRS